MNFLAHLHLADISQTSLAANLSGDFAKGSIERFPKHLQQGIWLHRQIDQLTDTHELTRELIQKFPKQYTRVAPILMDLAFDNMLAYYWDEYHHQTLESFCDKAYGALENTPELPEKLQILVPKMKEDNWLLHYREQAGLNRAINGVGQRLSNPALFDGAESAVEKLNVDIETAFRMFYPQLMAYSKILTRKTPAEYL